jgi:predicted nucleotidyltransferase
MIQILKVLVGSRSHGLATLESDFDYRGVFVVPTAEILKIGGHTEHASWLEGKDDDTSWELGHFLFLATKCNPTILETFLAPIVELNTNNNMWGLEIRKLFPYIWNSNDVKNAFIGYGLNQRKKFLDNKDGKPNKFAAAYLRSLYNAYELLTTGTFTIRIIDTPVGQMVKNFKEGNYTVGEVVNECLKWQKEVELAAENNPKEANLEPINEFLLKVRKEFWI